MTGGHVHCQLLVPGHKDNAQGVSLVVVRIGQCPRQEGYEQEQDLEREAPVEDESCHCFAPATTVVMFGELTESTVAVRQNPQWERRQSNKTAQSKKKQQPAQHNSHKQAIMLTKQTNKQPSTNTVYTSKTHQSTVSSQGQTHNRESKSIGKYTITATHQTQQPVKEPHGGSHENQPHDAQRRSWI
jgi:hypothetical protein